MNYDSDQTFLKRRSGGEENSWSLRNQERENELSSEVCTLNLSSLLSSRTVPIPNQARAGDAELAGNYQNSSSKEQILQRIRDLENVVLEQNKKILKYEETERSYVAALDRIARKDAEIGVVVESREKYYKEMKFLQEQLETKTEECDRLHQRILDLSRSLSLAMNASRKSVEMENTPSALGIDIRTTHDTSHTSHEISKKRKRRTFSTTPTVLPRCRNCNAVFDKLKPHEVVCSFHRAAPQPLKTWKPQLENSDHGILTDNLKDSKFWPCCGKVGFKEPTGCLRLKNHDLVFPEEE